MLVAGLEDGDQKRLPRPGEEPSPRGESREPAREIRHRAWEVFGRIRASHPARVTHQRRGKKGGVRLLLSGKTSFHHVAYPASVRDIAGLPRKISASKSRKKEKGKSFARYDSIVVREASMKLITTLQPRRRGRCETHVKSQKVALRVAHFDGQTTPPSGILRKRSEKTPEGRES